MTGLERIESEPTSSGSANAPSRQPGDLDVADPEHSLRILDESSELRDLLIEISRWSRVAERNGDLHARIASALARESSAAELSVGERQGRQPAQDIWRDPAAAKQRLYATHGQNDAKSVKPSGFEKADPLSDPTSGQGANAKPGLSDHA